MNYKTRKAVPKDAARIQKILEFFALRKRLLPRSEEEIIDNIRDFYVVEAIAENPEEKSDETAGDFPRICGCCALKIYSRGLAEIRSLAVDADYQTHGLGNLLLQACEQNAVENGLESVFALTYIPDFFTKNGYRVVTKEIFPKKIWRDCFKCPFFPDCNEIAVLKEL